MIQKKIVIIDDDENVRTVLTRTLEIDGLYQVTTAENGKAGIKLVRKTLPDLVLLDIIMPGIDGFEVLKTLKSDTKTMSIPVVILSGETSQEAQVHGACLYTDLYLTKPILFDELLRKIKQVFARR